METLMNISAVGLRVCAVLAVIGIVLAVYTYRKFNILDIYMIRSGRARRRSVSQLQSRSTETGRLTADTTEEAAKGNSSGKLKTIGKRKQKTGETGGDSPFKRKKHTGTTETFNAPGSGSNVPPPAQIMPVQPPAPAQPPQEGSAETTVLGTGEETKQPSDPFATTQLSKNSIEAALAAQDEPAVRTELRAPFEIVSSEMTIHTDEMIEL